MSKRVLIILAVGFISIIAAFFLYKHECTQETENLEEDFEEEKPVRKTKKVKQDDIIQEEKPGQPEPGATGTEAGSEPNE